jgi:hypothetical protein
MVRVVGAVNPDNVNLIRFGGQAKLGLFGLYSNCVTQIPRKKYCAAGKKKISTFFVIFFFFRNGIII